MDIWFTADSHYDHENSIKYSDRPFSNVKEMNECMMDKHNERVKKRDKVYHLGDFAFTRDFNRFMEIRRRLNGHMFLLRGNHDPLKFMRRATSYGGGLFGYSSVRESDKIKHGDDVIVMSHFPMYIWDCSHYGSFHLYGHVHNQVKIDHGKSMNVGVDVNDFAPVHIDEVIAAMKDKPDNVNFVAEEDRRKRV